MTPTPTDTKPAPIAVGVRDAAKMIGVSPRLVTQLIEKSKLPSFKLGERRLIRTDDLRAFVDSQLQTPAHQ